ncbi:MAG: RNA 2',3'-cyclic phosphodiesterase [Proteobacteria bacterium]|nr:RNA 2',3'-cyclic phosphodiesterase [Pseudomonadota bacterium]
MLHLFTGIGLPLSVRQQLSTLRGVISRARWMEPDSYHITLSFIGEVDETTAEDIDEALSGIRSPSFQLTLKGAGYFLGNKSSQHLWIGVDYKETLHRLKEKIDRAFEARRLPFEKRKYIPHVTVAKLKYSDESEAAMFMQQHNLFTSTPFEISEFILYQSYVGKEGTSYRGLKTYPFTPGATFGPSS